MLWLSLTMLAANPSPSGTVNLGSGQRGLVFIKVNPLDPRELHRTVLIACNLDPGYSHADYSAKDLNTQVIAKETLTPEYEKTIPSRYWSGWLAMGLFSFDVNAAFDETNLYRIEKGHIRIYPFVAQQEARKRYRLPENSTFLGAFDGRIFYWIKDHPREVFFRSADRLYRFMLQKRVTEPLGMAKGDPKGDLALWAVMMPSGWFSTTPRTLDWAILNVRDAELVGSCPGS
jgi:hypothetical protein